ncbi:MAG: UDP-N-acetylmuramate dehydrogenase [Bacteroidaceae bacterium]|nr:UDP-N-acetylmuramate dehydrogenase [Bacteroidaceae bacterium]
MINRYTQFPLLGHNTFGMDVQAAQFIEFDCEGDVMEIVREGIDAHHIVIGGGSNLLFLNDYSGTVLHSRIMDITVVEEDNDSLLLRVGSGVTWDDLVAYSVEKGWQGLENLSAIPGEVGASAVQNVGAYGVEAGDLIERVEAVSVINASKRCFSKQQCRYSYRSSIFKQEEKGKNIITYVTFRLNKTNKFVLTYGNLKDVAMGMGELSAGNIRAAVMQIRASKLPDTKEFGSAGSFFMNPVVSREKADALGQLFPEMPQYETANGVKLSAAWLIDRCGWKERRVGNVGVYKHQPLVLVNYGGATGCEVYDFSTMVCQSVKDKFGVELVREVIVVE